MRLFFKVLIFSFCGFLIFSTSNAKTCFPTTIEFYNYGWNPSTASGQIANFSTDDDPTLLLFKENTSDQTKKTRACYGAGEVGGTYIAVAITEGAMLLGTYLSINSYDSTKQANALNFPKDFRLV